MHTCVLREGGASLTSTPTLRGSRGHKGTRGAQGLSPGNTPMSPGGRKHVDLNTTLIGIVTATLPCTRIRPCYVISWRPLWNILIDGTDPLTLGAAGHPFEGIPVYPHLH
jgi:hypothetical protein